METDGMIGKLFLAAAATAVLAAATPALAADAPTAAAVLKSCLLYTSPSPRD